MLLGKINRGYWFVFQSRVLAPEQRYTSTNLNKRHTIIQVFDNLFGFDKIRAISLEREHSL